MIRIILTCLALVASWFLLVQVVPASAATVTVPGVVVIVPLDVASVTTGGVAVTALNAGNRTAGGWLLNPTGSAQPLCINEAGAVASGTVSAGSLICIAAGASFNLAPSGLPVSVVSSDSAHGFAGEGYKE
jgi:hypothetical protein